MRKQSTALREVQFVAVAFVAARKRETCRTPNAERFVWLAVTRHYYTSRCTADASLVYSVRTARTYFRRVVRYFHQSSAFRVMMTNSYSICGTASNLNAYYFMPNTLRNRYSRPCLFMSIECIISAPEHLNKYETRLRASKAPLQRGSCSS